MMVCQCSVHGIGMPFVLLAKGDGIPNFEFVTRTVWVSELVPAWREMKRWIQTSANNIMQIET